ncbi:cell division protein FtsZ [Clostridium botulinum C]|uniref:Cell division protein FtsZ n=2 Tax=Clostridium botulinum TaxID=1491 RepID=A0A9Q4TQ12_CLOBO|nr:tubulin-like doman-containing protein [Clostridium botulinum]KMJ93078.1 putative cell division GTPase FtsZ, diverged [Clostridium botulinum C str. Stockholm]MCD3195787.1 cell division protein FtsZ [Clostridium botulinum C]MCD3201203.1 cell division protein FtsZ [Clostridium botulinum C]MCD3206528.1 cell division protein FtsZ [Clostridium botulinum C]MCD3209159.1 cell division protein FtsZ [Clostridium botulinum C]
MEKKDILFVGIGEAGGKLLNEILKKDKRYVGLYINSNYDDFADLETANDNMYIITAGQGTGKNRQKSKALLKSNINSIMDEILKYRTSEVVHFLFSLGGGTGGGSTPTIIKALGKLQKNGRFNKIINITCILPAYDEGKRYRKNAIECWNEIAELENINSIYMLDNNSKKDEEEINIEFARQFDIFMNMSKNTPSKELKSRIDAEEIGNLATSVGSTVFYELPNANSNLEVSIAEALNSSIFATSEEDVSKCEYVGIVTQEGLYNQKEIENMFNPEEYTVGAYSKEHNFIVVTGRPPQKESIETLKESIEEEEQNKTNDNVLSNLKVHTDIDTKQPEAVQKKTQQQIQKSKIETFEEKSVDDLLEDDDLWDDIF